MSTGTNDAGAGLGGAVFRLWALFLGIGLLLAGNGLQGTLLGVVAQDVGFSGAVTGLIMTSYYVGFLAGSVGAQLLLTTEGGMRTCRALV